MGIKKKNNSDSESGEVKEDFLTEAEQNYIKTLNEVEREQFLSEIHERKTKELDRKRIINETEKANFMKHEEKLTKKRENKPDNEVRPQKKQKIEEHEYNHRSETGITLSDIEKIRISRDQLAKWCNHLYFEKTVKGAFVRINIGLSRDKREQIYLMCEVVDVISGDKFYEIEGKVKTDKELSVIFGKSKKRMRFDIVSNAEFTEKEFEEYKKRLEKDGMKPITQHHVVTKLQDIQTAINYKYTREEIDQLVEQHVKESLKKGKVEPTAILELEKLKVQLEDLKISEPSSDRNDKIRNLDKLIQELEKAIKFDDIIVESDIVLRLNERNRYKQQEIDTKRAEDKKKVKKVDVVEVKPKITQFELEQINKKKIIDVHGVDLEIDNIVLSNLKVPLREHPAIVFPHPLYKIEIPETVGKEVVLFEDWKRTYRPS